MLPAAPATDPAETLVGSIDDLRRWCLRRSRDPHLAEDVAQEAALLALQRWGALKEHASLRAWVFRIGQRRLSDAARRQRRALLPLTIEPVAPQPLCIGEGDPQERAECVRRAVRRLPLRLRQAVRLHYLRGFPIRDVADRLATTVNGVKARLYRARKILREETGS